jgi:hypothetical protein
VAAGWGVWHAHADPRSTSDFDQVWYAARALRAGLDPYVVIGPGRAWFDWDWPFYYPLPAAVAVLPLSFLPPVTARLAFLALSGGALGWAVARWAPHAWPLWVLVAKPSIGLAVAPYATRRSIAPGVIGCALLLAASFAVEPHWLAGWIENIRHAPHIAPLVLRPGGQLLLLALLRWRRREARLMLGLAVVPYTTVLYETLPVFLTARSRREGILLALAKGIANVAQMFVTAPDTPTLIARQGIVMIVCVYLPALALILRRPNAGAMPGWIESLSLRAPRWLRGEGASSAGESRIPDEAIVHARE